MLKNWMPRIFNPHVPDMRLLLLVTTLLSSALGVPTSRIGSTFLSIPANISDSRLGPHSSYERARNAIRRSFSPTGLPVNTLRKRDSVRLHPMGNVYHFGSPKRSN